MDDATKSPAGPVDSPSTADFAGKLPSAAPKVEPTTLKEKSPEMEPPQLEKAFSHAGVRYLSVTDAAKLSQTPRQTLLNWLKNKTPINLQPLEFLHFAPTNTYMVSEQSVKRTARRFDRLADNTPAGDVTIGETQDQSGYIGLTKVAEKLHISRQIAWLWLTQENRSPLDRPLDAIRCSVTGILYIAEKDVAEIARRIPNGMQRGRPKAGLQP